MRLLMLSSRVAPWRAGPTRGRARAPKSHPFGVGDRFGDKRRARGAMATAVALSFLAASNSASYGMEPLMKYGMEPLMNPLVAQLTHRSFPELAAALRSCSEAITREWEAAVRQAIPRMDRFTYTELKDSTPLILPAIADAVGFSD